MPETLQSEKQESIKPRRTKKKFFVLCSLLFVLCSLFFVHKTAQASDYRNMRHPLFEGVERVFIYVDQNIPPEVEAQLPPALRVKNIKQLLLDLYKQRFSSTDCLEVFKSKNRNPYGCDNQPVTLIEDSSVFHGLSSRFDKLTKDPATLNVFLIMQVITNRRSYDPPLETPIVVFALIQDREGQKIPIFSGSSFPIAFLTNQKNENSKNLLTGLLMRSIHY